MNKVNMSPVGMKSNGGYSRPAGSVNDLVEKAGDTIRRTNLQSAAKTPAGAVAATAKYIATDVLRDSIISPIKTENPSGIKYLNSLAAINGYKKS